MSEEINSQNESNKEQPTAVSEVVTEVPAEVSEKPKETKVSNDSNETHDDIFITENDTFSSVVKYYKIDGDLKVQKVDEDFDMNTSSIREITFTCKYPSQGDYQSMINSGSYKDLNEQISGLDLIKLEMTRLSLLLRSWSIPKPIGDILEADPKIVKAMLVAVSEKLGLKGIF